jgi:DNA-directed RNA polymerase subunit beta'
MINPEELYASLTKRLAKSVETSLSVDGPKKLKVNKVWVEDKLDANDLDGQLDAKLRGQSWAIPVYADISLFDPASGKEIDRSKKLKVMDLPKLTPRYSFIVQGEEFQVANQLRLKPGVYVKSRPTETSANFKFPIGFSKFNFSIDYTPKDKRWTTSLDGKTIPLYSHLHALGVTDDEIVDAIGLDQLDRIKGEANLKRDVAKLRSTLTGEQANPQALGENSDKVREVLFALPMEPDVPRMKYGKTYEKFSKGLVLDALKNASKVLSGDEEPDIDSSRFKEFRTFDDILTERVEKSSRVIQSRIKLRMRDKSTVREVVQPDKLSDIVTSFFNRSQLSNYPLQSNPVNFLTGLTKTTVFGEGSIGNKRALQKEERDVDPSMFGVIDPLHTPEAGDIGAVMHITVNSKKDGNAISASLYDLRAHKFVDVRHNDLYDKRVAYPNEFRHEGSKMVPIDAEIRIMHRGKTFVGGVDDVDLVVDRPSDLFDYSTNLVPFVNAMHGGRGLMAAKMADQAVALKNPEAPLVQSSAAAGGDPKKTFERLVASTTTLQSPFDGTVIGVEKGSITVEDTKGHKKKVSIYNDFPLNARSFITSKPTVTVGQKVKEGDLLADSSFTRDGALAVGTNLRVAWLAYKGHNYEDGIVVSETAAKKLTSVHMYKVDHRTSQDGVQGRDKFAAYYPSKFTGAQLAKLDDDGVIKVGQRVQSGDPVVVYLAHKDTTPEDVALGRISRNLVRPYSDSSNVWEEPFEGEVAHVQKMPGMIRVTLKTEEPLQTGDKVVSRYAAKGLVSKIVPDHEMPHTTDGKPLEILLNPMGLPTRMNPSQIYEALAGKISEKTGKPYIVENFERGDIREKMRSELKQHGISDTEDVIDPETGRTIGKITVGKQFIMKLEHASKEKFNARDPSNAYTADMRPMKSGEGAQTIGHMELAALMSHGAMHNIRDMSTYKAAKNDEFWRALQMNEPLPAPAPSFAFEKFISLLKGAGINVERKGTKFQLKPLTDDQTEAISAGALSSSRMLLGKNMKPEKGGLFDEDVTGGLMGKKWSHIELPYEVPNPMFESAIKGALGFTQKEFDDIMEERVHVDRFGKKTDEKAGGMTGPKAIRRMMEAIDGPKAIRELKSQAKTARGSDLNAMNRAIRFLVNMKDNGISPGDLFISKVPVLPPVYRPIYPLPDGTMNVSDVNYLYRDLLALKGQVQDMKGLVPDEHSREQRADLYHAVKAIAGVGDPISSENYKGIIDVVTGSNPKASFFQSRVIKKQQELSGRASIVGNPTIGMDEVGIPDDMAWVIFKPFIIQKLVDQGIAPLAADEMVTNRAAVARDSLMRVIAERPVILNRAPTLHKHGIIGLHARLVNGKSIHLNQLVTVGLNADFDGDTVGIHVPVTPEAVREAIDMLPSANPMSTSEKILVTPRHEAQVGLYRLTTSGKKTDKAFPGELDAIKSFHDGEISETDLVHVGGVETTVGRILINKALPEKLRKHDIVLDKKTVEMVLSSVARENPRALAPVVDTLKDIGNEYAYLSGLTVNLSDLEVGKGDVEEIMKKHDVEAAQAVKTTKPGKELDKKVVAIYSRAYDSLRNMASTRLKERASSLHQMVASGGRGDISQVAQIVAAPVLSEDVRGRVHTYAIRTGFGHGMTPADYWVSNYGSRRGTLETKLSTAEPGALTKSMVQTSIENRIVPGDAPADENGLDFHVDDREAVGRFVMKAIPGVAKRGDLFDSQLREKAKSKGVKSVELGSPLMSTHPAGTYAMSYGLDERGRVPRSGAFIGITASQAIGEPMTQLILGSKHVQGVTGKGPGSMTGFEKLKTILTMPEEIANKALVSKEFGHVESVHKVPGGWDVRIGGKTSFTAFEPVVKSGKAVSPGDRLSEGVIDPRDLLDTKGIDHTRKYMVDEIYDIFKGNVRKKHIETVVRSVTDTALVTDSGQRTDFIEGDVVPINVVRAENRRGAVHMPVELARNAMLMEKIDELGGVERILTDDDIRKLKDINRSHVTATPTPVQYRPVLKGVDIVPLQRKDWMAGLSFRRLKDVIQKGVSEGWKTDVRGWNPIPGIAYGATIADAPELPKTGKAAG